MAFTSVTEIGTGNRGSHELGKWRRTYTRTFLAISNDMTDGVQAASAAMSAAYGIFLGSPYVTGADVDLGALCNKIDPQRDSEDWHVWTVTVEYDSVLGSTEDQQEADPIQRPPKFSWRGRLGEEPVEVDRDGIYLHNSAWDPYDPPVMRRASSAVLTIVRNEANPNLVLMDAYRDTYNTDAFFGFPEGKWITGEFSVSGPEREENVVFYVCEYNFELRRDGWKRTKILDKGYNYIKTVATASGNVASKVAVKDAEDGRSLNGQVLLDGAGGRLAENGTPVYYITNGYKLYNGAPYAVFGF